MPASSESSSELVQKLGADQVSQGDLALDPEARHGDSAVLSPPSQETSVIGISALWRKLRGSNGFGANAVLNGLTNLVQALLGISTGVMVARLLGPRGRGELAAIQTWPVLIGYLALLGTGDALVYYSAREPRRAGRYLGSATILALLATGPFALVAFVAMPMLLSAQTPSIIAAARWYLLIIPLLALAGLPCHPLRGRGDFAAWNAVRLTPTLSWMAILIVAWLVSYRRPTGLAWAYVVATGLLIFVIGSVAWKRIPGSFLPETQNFRPLLRYGLPCMMTTLPQILNFRLDQMVMTGFFPPLQLGLYVAAVSWSGALNPVLYAMESALFPEIASRVKESEKLRAFSRAVRLATLIAMVLGMALFLITPWGIVLLFGARFRPAIPAGLILVPAAAVAGLNQVLEAGLRGMGRPAAVMQAEIAGLIVTVIALWLMLGPLGILGAAIASILGYTAVTVALLAHAHWITGASPVSLVVPRSSDIQDCVKQIRLMMRPLGSVID